MIVHINYQGNDFDQPLDRDDVYILENGDQVIVEPDGTTRTYEAATGKEDTLYFPLPQDRN